MEPGCAGLRWLARSASAVLILSFATAAGAVEIGTDAGLNFSSLARVNMRFAFPAYDETRTPSHQFVRVGLPIGKTEMVELAPGVEITSYPYYDRHITSTMISTSVSYLAGRIDSPRAAPYCRVGAHGKFFHSSAAEFSPSHSETQFGLSGGGGVRWRLGRVIGIRAEAVATRWLDGDYFGYWDFALRGGISAFTK